MKLIIGKFLRSMWTQWDPQRHTRQNWKESSPASQRLLSPRRLIPSTPLCPPPVSAPRSQETMSCAIGCLQRAGSKRTSQGSLDRATHQVPWLYCGLRRRLERHVGLNPASNFPRSQDCLVAEKEHGSHFRLPQYCSLQLGYLQNTFGNLWKACQMVRSSKSC